MAAHKQNLLRAYRAVIPYRPDALFTDFLPHGYALMTLSSVPEAQRETLLWSKIRWGMFITLLDDFADNPRHFDADLLEELHRSPFLPPASLAHLTGRQQEVARLASALIEGALRPLETLPHYRALLPFLRFDIEQFLNANRYSALLTEQPHAVNLAESVAYGHHNMGMIAIGMIDLMAVPTLAIGELGAAREVFHLGQRFGRICNVLVTAQREAAEGDVTGELASGATEPKLRREAEIILARLRAKRELSSFSIARYADSLAALRELHERLEGVL